MSGQRKALIIANDEYEQEALRDLLAPAADAEALRRVLGDPQIGDFAVRVVRNEPSYVIEAQIEDLFSDSRSDDLLLLHFSGHGLKSESGELFFAASNTRPNRLGSTAVAADFVRRCMRDSRSRSIVLLLDCCYAGAFPQGVKVRAGGDVNVLDSFPQERSGGRGRAVITASSAMEYAFEGDRLADDQHRRPSVFTSALVEGLATGDADRDEDGLVSLSELYDYVFDKVREQNPHQTPSRQVELEGELYLARSRRQRIRPAPIPPDLQAAITDQNMYTRRGAVSELQSRLASEDLPVAAGAYEALAGLARTDIRYVADPAAAAVSQAVLRPEETELHFGEQQQGSAPPHRMVRLLGPPIARACAPRASHDWIRVTETTEGLDISVDTTSTGTLRGSLDLKGPTGTAVIGIDVEIVPQEMQRQQQIEQLQAQMREHAAAQDWDAVLAISGQLAALAPSAADPGSLASTAREQIIRRQQAEEPANRLTQLGGLPWTTAGTQGRARAEPSGRPQSIISKDDISRITAAMAGAAHAASHGQAVTPLEALEQARREAEERAAARRQQQIGQLQAQMRGFAAGQDWDAVLAVSDQLAALDPAAADPDALASTAREQITRRQEAEEAAVQRREQIEQITRRGQDSARTTQPQAAESHRVPAPTSDEFAAAPQPTTLATPSPARPPIRTGAAFAGTVIALLAGVAGLIAAVLLHTYHVYFYGSANFLGEGPFLGLPPSLLAVAVALTALMQRYRPVIIGFLQGMWWLAASFLAVDVKIAADIFPHFSGGSGATILVHFACDVLGVIAAILLMVSWSPAVDRRRAPPVGALPMMLLGAAGLSQITILIFYLTYPYNNVRDNILGSAGVLVVLALGWYAMSIRAHALGGALVLGWVTVAAFMLRDLQVISGVRLFLLVLECVLLAAVVVLAIIYVRAPSDPEGSANK